MRPRLDLRDPATWRGPYVRRRMSRGLYACAICGGDPHSDPGIRVGEEYLERSEYRAHVRCAEALGRREEVRP